MRLLAGRLIESPEPPRRLGRRGAFPPPSLSKPSKKEGCAEFLWSQMQHYWGYGLENDASHGNRSTISQRTEALPSGALLKKAGSSNFQFEAWVSPLVKPQNPADSALPATLSNFCPRRCLPAPLRDISKNCQGTIFALENKIFRRKIPALTQARRFCGFFKSSKPAVFSRLENLKVFKLPPGTVKGERASALSCSPGLFGQFETAKPANAKIARIKRWTVPCSTDREIKGLS